MTWPSPRPPTASSVSPAVGSSSNEMVWLAARSLIARRLSALVTGFGMLIATVGFSLLASTSQTAAAMLHGDIASTWDTPYDLLIRPPDSLTGIEGAQGQIGRAHV